MATPTTLVYDLAPPRRPGIGDVGGGAKLDDQEYPPDAVTMLTAADENQAENLLVAYGKVTPAAVFSLRFSAGAPILDIFSCASSLPTLGSFTVVDNGTGDTSVTWPANTFPSPVAPPFGGLTGATVGMMAVEAITNGVRVRTLGSGGAAADLACTVVLL